MATDRAQVALDETTFGSLTDAFRRDLLLHCYRFTGSVHDAEDLVQETLTKAWRGRAEYRGEAGLRTWLRRIATRVCLDALRRDRTRRTLPSRPLPGSGEWVGWLEPIPDELIADAATDPAAVYDRRESVSLAFVAALQALAPRQRAVLILRDVLAMSAAEVADVLETTVSSVNSLLHRARRTMRSAYSGPPASIASESEVSLAVRRYIAAWEAGDVDALVRLLKADALLEMPPLPSVAIGPTAIRAFLSPTILDGVADRWRGIATRANGGPAVALYQRTDGGYRFSGIQLLSAEDGRIAAVTAYMEPDLAARFGLAVDLPA